MYSHFVEQLCNKIIYPTSSACFCEYAVSKSQSQTCGFHALTSWIRINLPSLVDWDTAASDDQDNDNPEETANNSGPLHELFLP